MPDTGRKGQTLFPSLIAQAPTETEKIHISTFNCPRAGLAIMPGRCVESVESDEYIHQQAQRTFCNERFKSLTEAALQHVSLLRRTERERRKKVALDNPPRIVPIKSNANISFDLGLSA